MIILMFILYYLVAQMQFTYDNMEASWSLSVLKFGNVTNNQVHIFDYADCGGVIEVPDDVSYFCSKYRFRLVHYILYYMFTFMGVATSIVGE